jgi:D-alanyl-D-alanine carboxypeptidase
MRKPNPLLKLAMVVLSAGVITASCESTGNSENSNTTDPAFEVSTSSTAPTAPLKISQSKGDVALCEEINQLINSRQEDYERWGLIVLSLKDGSVPCARNPRQLFSPASIQKLVTSAVALDKLGIDYRFKTSLYAGGKPKDGVIHGDLILYGRGAPDFNAVAANKLITNLKALGVRRITGDVIGDESYFRADGLGEKRKAKSRFRFCRAHR